ncbi:hypothetical protein Aasi_1229 [Candidatus Amoebophilus asiaticus 5a2]|uniref:Uncharacterized protein n=1 Tax=Amoebophilus asiaticus (strain 5a2) TaxID=452471 RepID=B3ETK2_AMOA5|nr:ankyrin repeat domain-containing protein [Candidatus Amoebophilus asiaticus]ACE06554.1 hypothetical protein Aasi_1229 [Candidatus Amoebophilus asiaticus 5a2]
MKNNYTLTQQLIARLLLIGLCLQSCGEGFDNHPLISTQEEQIDQVQVTAKQLADTTFIPKEDHQIDLDQEANELQPAASQGDSSLLNKYQKVGGQGNNIVVIQEQDRKDKPIKRNEKVGVVHYSNNKLTIRDSRPATKQPYTSPANKTTQSIAGQQQLVVNNSMKALLTNQVCITKEGYQLKFEQKGAGTLEAIVENRFPTGFTKQRLPVVIDGGLSCTEAAVGNIAWQKQFIHVSDQYVYVGQNGLLGGGKDKGLVSEEEQEEANEKEPLGTEINLSKEAIKSLWQIGQEVGEEKYRDRALGLLALEALNKGGVYTTRYLKKLNQLGTIPIIVGNQSALPAAWQGKTPDELQAVLHTLYLQALEGKERHLSTLAKAEQAAEQLAILELKYHFQKLLEPTSLEKEGLVKDIQKGIDRLGILPMSELISLRKSYLSYLVREALTMDLATNTAHVKKFIEKVGELAQKGKSKAKHSQTEREALNAFSGKLYRQLGGLSKKLSQNSHEAVKSIEWQRSYYLKATKLKDAVAYYQLGLLYGDSNSTYYDMHEAKEALEESARLGYVLAFYALSEHYEKEGDTELALYWQEQAAKKGHPQALYKLSRASEQEARLNYLEQAGFSGDSQAQYALGNYYWGQGDYATAIEWYNKAAYQGVQASYAYLGIAARKGLGCPKDIQAALGYYLRSEKAGEDNAIARYGRARLYEKGEGVKADLGTALSLYTQASELGHAKASYHAGKLHLSGQVEGCNIQAGYALLEKAGKAGIYQACLLLGKLYEHGWGRLPDPTAALHWYSQAAINSSKAKRMSDLAQLALLHKLDNDIGIEEEKKLSLLDQASLVEKNKYMRLEEAYQEAQKAKVAGEEMLQFLRDRNRKYKLDLVEKSRALEQLKGHNEAEKGKLYQQLQENEEQVKKLTEKLCLYEQENSLAKKNAALLHHQLTDKEQAYQALNKQEVNLRRQLAEKEEAYKKLMQEKYLQQKTNKELAQLLINKEKYLLHAAVENGQLAVVKMFLKKGANIQAKDVEGKSPLHLAARAGHLEIAKLLLEKGADTEARNSYGNSPLHSATKNGQLEIAKLLLESGADIEAKGEYDISPLGYAVHYNHPEVAKLLIEHGAYFDIKGKNRIFNGVNMLFWVARCGYLEIAKLLLEHGADVNVKDERGNSLLTSLCASQKPHIDTAKFLIEKGADVNAKDGLGNTPLYKAVEQGYLELARLLIDKGADLLATNNQGLTPLQVVTQKNHTALVELLTKK